jgi:hypothetical protein
MKISIRIKNDYVQPGDTVIYEPAVRALRDKEWTGQKAIVRRVSSPDVYIDFPGHPNFKAAQEDVHLVSGQKNDVDDRKANPSWMMDEPIWKKAKEAIGSGDGDSHWAQVTAIYKKMGGRIKK